MKSEKTDTCKNNSFLCNLRFYFLTKPKVKTLVEYKTPEDRKLFGRQILSQLGVPVDEYSVLNIHKIGIELPVKDVFEELLHWDGNSNYWPNKIARVKRIDGNLENIFIFMFGIERLKFRWLKGKSVRIKPLFNLNALKFQYSSSPGDNHNARYLLYECSGGYPIGIFSLYARESIPKQNETRQTQLFSVVAFNFYGKKHWFYTKIINPVWEKIHNKVTNNVLNRMKNEFESKFYQRTLMLEKEI